MYYQEYLRQFAYLDERNPVSREQELNGDRERHFQLAVMRFQRSVGLNVTGECSDARCEITSNQLQQNAFLKRILVKTVISLGVLLLCVLVRLYCMLLVLESQ